MEHSVPGVWYGWRRAALCPAALCQLGLSGQPMMHSEGEGMTPTCLFSAAWGGVTAIGASVVLVSHEGLRPGDLPESQQVRTVVQPRGKKHRL